ncbi:MAG: alginate lyase family protein, partial [Candidatus Omnitrophica bacterium]|nr:alginate lyase family protein [Candidatus Omnitrophota bacterium]
REAEKNCRHIFDLLGSGEVYLGEKINWHVDFKNSYSWEAAKLYRDIEIPYGKADIKVPWELSRFQHVAFLAEAYLLSGDEKYTNEFTDQVDDWINNNPPGRGVNWACAMDVAIRACNWITGYHIFKHSSLVKEEFLGKFLMSMRQHGRHIMANLEYSPFVTSNHYLSDIAGLIFIGVSFPQFEESKRWKKFAVKELIKEMDKQVYEDGCDFEASTCYHRLSLELFFFAVLAVARAHSGFNGGNYLEAAQTVFGRQFMRKLFKMFDATSYLLKPNGRMPQIGDNDSGRLFTLFPREILDHRYILALGAVFFRESAWKIKELFSQDDDIACRRRQNRALRVPRARSCASPSRQGRAARHRADTTAARHGYRECSWRLNKNGNGGHCHNDRLSFEWFAEGKDIIVDPGTYVYTQDPQARNRFRSTNLHNTVTIDKEEQNKISLSHLFSMGNELGFKSSEWKGDEDYRVFLGQYRTRRLGGERVIHQREVKFYTKEARLKICDSFEGRKRHALQWNFILSPYLKRQVRSIESEKDFRKEEALYSLAYGKLEKTDKLTMTRETGLPFRIEITLEIRNDILRAHVKE